MKKIRIGNDIQVLWEIFTGENENIQPYNIEGKNLSLYIRTAFKKIQIREFSVNGNKVEFTIWGKDQKHTGRYSLTLIENEGLQGMHSVDECDAFCLVRCSCEAGGEEESRVDIVSLQLKANMMLGGGIVDDELSETSTNAVQNKVITKALKDTTDFISYDVSLLGNPVYSTSDMDGYSQAQVEAAFGMTFDEVWEKLQKKNLMGSEMYFPSNVSRLDSMIQFFYNAPIMDSNAMTLAIMFYRTPIEVEEGISISMGIGQFETELGYDDTELHGLIAEKQDTLVSGENIKTINNESILGSGNIDTNLRKITYAELVALRDSAGLIPGMQYRITDYITTTKAENTQSAGHAFDVIVTADDKSTLNEKARAIQHGFNINDFKDAFSGTWAESMIYKGEFEYNDKSYHLYESSSADIQMLVDFGNEEDRAVGFNPENEYVYEIYPNFTRGQEGESWDAWDDGINYGESINFKVDPRVSYFDNSDLAAWEIWYCLDNDAERFLWADATNGKGVIYYMKDEYDNECPYDFKNIQFKRGIYAGGGGLEKEEGDGDFEVFCYTFSFEKTEEQIIDASIYGNNGYLLNDEGQISGVYGNIIKPYMSYGHYPENPTTPTQVLNNIVFFSSFGYEELMYYGCYNNSFGYDCSNNTFGNACSNNTFGNACNGNYFANNCNYNTFGDSCSNNTFDSTCESNTFGYNCFSNTFGDSCYSNTFGNYCFSNTFGYNCDSNTFGKECHSNTFDNGCRFNSFGDNCNCFNVDTLSRMSYVKLLGKNTNLCINNPAGTKLAPQNVIVMPGVGDATVNVSKQDTAQIVYSDADGNVLVAQFHQLIAQ